MADDPELRNQLLAAVHENVIQDAEWRKLFASEMTGHVADHGIERVYRDVRLLRIHGAPAKSSTA